MKGLLKFKGVLLGCSLLICMISCGDQTNSWVKNTNTGGALGTSYSIIYLAKDSLNFQRGIDSVFYAVNASMSTYLPDSDITKINKGDSTVIVDHMFEEVFTIAKEVYAVTDGYFDPTVGVLVNAWGFGPGAAAEMDSSSVKKLLKYVGFNKVNLTADRRIQKDFSEIQLDFNAIAKGYAIDRLAAYLDSEEIENYLVEVGGEIVTKGENRSKGKKWVVGVDDPQVELGRRLKITLTLKDQALASSGNYRKFRIDSLTGKKYVHTIDPKSGFTKNSNVLAVSVIAENCATADAYATAFMAMDLDESKGILNNTTSLEGYVIYLDESGAVQEFMTPGFKEQVVW